MKQQPEKLNSPFLHVFLLTNEHYRLHRHLLAFAIMGIVLMNVNTVHVEPFGLYTRVIFFFMLIFLFYTNMYWLIPQFLFKNKYSLYITGILICMGIVYLIVFTIMTELKPYVDFRDVERAKGPSVVPFIFLVAVLVAASTAIKLFQRWLTDSERINELEKITMQAELEQLKNQINPHFLFNMLNNANVLVQKDPEKASQVLIKLSDFLRYQLYDCARAKVLLTADIHFLSDFLNLEKIRRDNFEIVISKQGELSGVQIAPLLLITFVENAVKHNMDAENGSCVHLHFQVENNWMEFKCVNSKPGIPAEKNENGGLGLTNVKRRLELLYPSKHILLIEDKAKFYTVILKIKL